MFLAKKSNRVKFLMVVTGLILVIGLVAGGTYFLNDQDLISIGDMVPGEMTDVPMPDLAEGASRPPRPDGEGEGISFNSGALIGILKVVLQIVLVVVAVSGGQWMIAWLQDRRRRAKAQPS